jgi:putative ABC transport system permease protein
MLALWALGLLAAYGPAWRASRIPPAVATRSG